MKRSINPKKFRPVSNRVLIQKDEKEKQQKGILLSDEEISKTKQLTGVVLSVGPGRPGEKMETKPGDIVMFGEYSGTTIGNEEDRMIVMEEHHILGIL